MSKAERRRLQEQFGSRFGQIAKVERREEAIKAALIAAARKKKLADYRKAASQESLASKPKPPAKPKDPARRRASQLIDSLLMLSKGSLEKIRPVVEKRVRDGEFSPLVLEVLEERIKENQGETRYGPQPTSR